ncbi:ABC transporter ATP-binding protein [Marinilactibacillus kalidii]|uniref:ABC transporter ATP-binding protein n=1 Tax=Marinilactibacillus kalidii TaxID=2820274 RepID=UPI001ABEE378|nr:ATP-binding cassette domain-containing protein [Marinilactibacillus kalidii]
MNPPILSLKNVSYQTDQTKILENISFDVQKGENITITGPSGSGKSTLLKMIGSLFTPTSGTIAYKGEQLETIDPLTYRKAVSYFFQNASLFDETVKDNLAFPYEIRDQEIDESQIKTYLKQVELPTSYYDKPVNALSGGEKQRIALVRNLLFKPEVLLLDEITSALDAENQEIILSLLNERNQKDGVTILKVTHDETEIAESTRVIRIVKGRMEDSHGE